MEYRNVLQARCLPTWTEDPVAYLRNGAYGLIEIKIDGTEYIKDGVAVVPIGCLKD